MFSQTGFFTGVITTLSAIHTFRADESRIRSIHKDEKAKEEIVQEYEDLCKVLKTFKKVLPDLKMLKKEEYQKIIKDMDEKVAKEIWKDILELEKPGKKKDREGKVQELQTALFWEKLMSFQEVLQNLQDERLKRGRKVEKLDKSSDSNKGK
jgi:hypothetical protein